jgi:hypothetical protein
MSKPLTRRLVRLYPPAWQARYGEEFVAVVGEGPLHAQQVVDIVSGAIDAWLSADVRRATAGGTSQHPGGHMFSFVCTDSNVRYSTRDGWIAAGVLILVSGLFAVAGIAARRNGAPVIAEVLRVEGLPLAIALSMPFWLLKGQSRKVQGAVIGFTVVFATLVAIF